MPDLIRHPPPMNGPTIFGSSEKHSYFLFNVSARNSAKRRHDFPSASFR
jgi:hypothetical protein